MPITTTNINLSTTPVVLFSTATTWAHNRNCSLYDPISFALVNSGVTAVRIGGPSVSTVAGVGFPITSGGGTFTWDVKRPGDQLWAVTSASTSNVDLMADGQ